MKKNICIFLLITSSIFSQEEDFSKIFSNFDSIQKESFRSHINRVVDLTIYDYANQKNKKSKEILIVTKLDSLGRLSLIYIKDSIKNKEIKEFIIALYQKIPPILIEKGKSQIFSANFTLENNINITKWRKSIFNKSEKDIKEIFNLEKIPRFKNSTIRETNPLENFNANMSNHIKRHFNYPSYAVKNNITGKVDVFFYIEEDGNINRIISYNSHPSLQLECISIIKKLSQFEPGYLNNKPTKVAYCLPITFKLQ